MSIYHYFHSMQNNKLLCLQCELFNWSQYLHTLCTSSGRHANVLKEFFFFFKSRHISSPTTNKQHFNNSESVRDFLICN